MNRSSLLSLAAISLLLAGCGPSLEVTSPGQERQKVSLNGDGTVSFSLAAYGYRIQPAGGCGEDNECGHLHARVYADEQTGKYSYVGRHCGEELEVEGLSFTFDLANCPRQTGLFSVNVHLANDDHIPFQGSGIAAQRRFVVE